MENSISDGMDAGGCDLKVVPLDGVYMLPLIGPSRWHRSLDGNEMVAIRQRLGVTQATFAARCGHSQQFQVQVEQPGNHEISLDKAKEIIAAIKFYK